MRRSKCWSLLRKVKYCEDLASKALLPPSVNSSCKTLARSPGFFSGLEIASVSTKYGGLGRYVSEISAALQNLGCLVFHLCP